MEQEIISLDSVESDTTIWTSGGTWNVNYQRVTQRKPTDCRWLLVQDRWCLVDESDGEVLARVYEERGIWAVAGDDEPVGWYISEAKAKDRAEDMMGPVNIVHTTRQNSEGIP